MRIRKNDQVTVLSGKDKNKKGKVMQSFPAENKIVVEGVNTTYKHLRGRRQGESGQKVEYFGPIDASNVKLICPACSKPTRVGYKNDDKVGKQRVCKKCKAVIGTQKEDDKKKK